MVKNHIYNEDCLKTLKKMKDDSVDVVITSPPQYEPKDQKW